MVNRPSFYFDLLYPFQNRVIAVINQADSNFYLTGGTAASRGYLDHRFSDDLDYFVNDDDRFGLWVERVIQVLTRDWGFCCQKNLSLQAAITDAQSKAAGVFPADLARVLLSTKKTDWETIRWIQAPPVETFINQLHQLGESLLFIGKEK